MWRYATPWHGMTMLTLCWWVMIRSMSDGILRPRMMAARIVGCDLISRGVASGPIDSSYNAATMDWATWTEMTLRGGRGPPPDLLHRAGRELCVCHLRDLAPGSLGQPDCQNEVRGQFDVGRDLALVWVLRQCSDASDSFREI